MEMNDIVKKLQSIRQRMKDGEALPYLVLICIILSGLVVSLIVTRPEAPLRPFALQWGPTFGGYEAEYEDNGFSFDIKTDDGLYDNKFTFSVEISYGKPFKNHTDAQLAAEDLVLRVLGKVTEE